MQFQGERSESNSEIHWCNCIWKSLLMMLWHQLTCRRAGFMGIFVALHTLTFSLTIAFDKSVEGWVSAALWDAYKAISHICFAAFHQCGLCSESAVSAYLKLVLPCSYCYVTHTWVLSFSYHTYYTCQCIPLAPSYLCFPISPLCCIVLPASSPPYHLQWKSNGLIPTPAGSPLPTRNDVYQSDSIRTALSACTLLIPSVFAMRTQERQRCRSCAPRQ